MERFTKLLLVALLAVALPAVAWSQAGPPEDGGDRDQVRDPAQDCSEFVDEDGDGVCDNCGGGGDATQDPAHERDRDRDRDPAQDCSGFIDEDGDGICDNCGSDHEAVQTQARRRFRRGDADGDGGQNLADAVYMLRAMFRNGPLGCADAADANDDGSVDISDPVALLRHLFQHQSGDGIPAPYRNAGEDPTPDGLGCDA